jgi:hypothetical protein
MSVPDRVLGRSTSDNLAIERVARTVHSTEIAVTNHEIERWGDLQRLMIDLSARAKASERAFDLDVRLYELGLVKAGGDPVKQELMLRYLQDQNADFRALINQALRP